MSAAQKPLCFVDALGGGLAALAAGVAQSLGRTDALALTTAKAVSVPDEVGAVLAEIGVKLPPVARLPGGAPDVTDNIDLGTWPLFLLPPEQGELERLSAARIARDRLERKLER
ncbi:MAG: hypothetical protein ABI193_16420 [Minicystis sp.]